MRAQLRLAALWEHLRGSLWVLPALFVLGAVGLGTVLALARPLADDALGAIAFVGGAEGAREVLGVIAGAMITVTSLTFTLTVVALQMASSQFSPRVLREFLTDRGNQTVLGIFLATFAYSLAVIRLIDDADGQGEAMVPRLAVSVAFLLALVSVGALVFFIHHLAQQLRVDRIIKEIAEATLRTIDRHHPDPAGSGHEQRALPQPTERAYRVLAERSGYLQAVTAAGLVRGAKAHDAVVQLRPRIGAQVSAGTTLAWIWPREADADASRIAEDEKAWKQIAHDNVHIGGERTMQQDVAFGLRQLVDVGARALSTGLNDPTTASDVLGWLSVVICRLATRDLDVGVKVDVDGEVRAILPTPWFADYLRLACDQFRLYGAAEPQVLLAVLELLLHAAEVAVDEQQRAAIEAECTRTVEVAEQELDETDLTRVRAAADLVQETLAAGEHPHPAPERLAPSR